MKNYAEFIVMFGEAPESQLDKKLSKECREFIGDDPVRFLRNLQDKCVHYGASSDFVIRAIDILLSTEIESETEKQQRRVTLEKEMSTTRKYG